MDMSRGSFTRFMSALLLTSLIMVSCGESAASSPAVTTAADTGASENGGISTEPEETTVDYDPHIEAVDFGGRGFNILYNGNQLEPNLDFAATELDGEALNDAIFERDSKLGESKVQGRDHFGSISEATDWTRQLSHAEKVGVGTRDYELVRI